MIVNYAFNELHLVQQLCSNLANTSLGWHWLGWLHLVQQLFNIELMQARLIRVVGLRVAELPRPI